MKSGPPKTPSALNALRGNPGKRAVNTDEPKPSTDVSITAPLWLKAEARDIWNGLAPELHRLGILSVLDVQALAGGCRWWAIYRKADAALRRGLTAKSPSNGRQAAPEIAIAHKAFDTAMSVFSRFGITPAERTRLHAPQPKEMPDGGAASDVPTDPHDQLAERRRARAGRPASA